MDDDDDILENALGEHGEDTLPKWRRLDVSLPPSWKPTEESVVEAAKGIAVIDNKAVEDSGLPVFDVHLYVLTITCLQVEKLIRSS